MYKTIRLAPYFILTVLGIIFIVLYNASSTEQLRIVFINLASSSFFVVVAYLFYDLIKSYIEKRDSRYIDSYIRSQISHDVFIVLYALKKYLHGYNLETNTVKNIFAINSYSKDHIESLIVNQSYIGFQIFKEMEDIREFFHGALENNLFIKYSPREYVMNLLKVIDLVVRVEQIFRNDDNYLKSPEKAVEFICVNGKEINPENEESRFLLLKRTQIKNRAVVYDSGRFDQPEEDKLLDRYTLKPRIAGILANQIYELNGLLHFWLPEEFHIKRYDKSYRIIKDYFSLFTKAVTRTKRIYVADIVDYGTNIEAISKLEAVKEELESNLMNCNSFLENIASFTLPKDDRESLHHRINDEDEDRLRRGMEQFFPNIRNDTITLLRTTKYVSFPAKDRHTFDKIDDFNRWCNLYSSNLGVAELLEPEKYRIVDIRETIQEGIDIINRRILELESK